MKPFRENKIGGIFYYTLGYRTGKTRPNLGGNKLSYTAYQEHQETGSDAFSQSQRQKNEGHSAQQTNHLATGVTASLESITCLKMWKLSSWKNLPKRGIYVFQEKGEEGKPDWVYEQFTEQTKGRRRKEKGENQKYLKKLNFLIFSDMLEGFYGFPFEKMSQFKWKLISFYNLFTLT